MGACYAPQMIRLPASWQKLDQLLGRCVLAAGRIRALATEGGLAERRRLARALRQGRTPTVRWRWRPQPLAAETWRQWERAWELTGTLPPIVAEAYRARLEELRLEMGIVESLGRPARLRALVARRYAHGGRPVRDLRGERRPLGEVARRWLEELPVPVPEARTLPSEAPRGEPSARALFEAMIRAAGLQASVVVRDELVARAASAERQVLLANRRFGRGEALGLAVHEVLGHLVSAANARAQAVGLLRFGTAEAFEDQEGLALWFEERAGLLDVGRRRILAGRVVATDMVLRGAAFPEVAEAMFREHGFEPEMAVALAERAVRGGGVARDAGYLLGWLRVREAVLRDGARTERSLRAGRVAVGALPLLEALRAQGLLREPPYVPSLARSLRATEAGTSLETSPPRAATSLTSPEAT